MLLGQTLIDKAASVVGSRYKLAQTLNENQSFLSMVARGLKPASPALQARAAAIAGEDPRDVALNAIADQEKDPEKQAELKRLFGLGEWRKR